MKKGMIGTVYGINVLPNTATELLQSLYEKNPPSKESALEMAAYLDERYKMSGNVPVSKGDDPMHIKIKGRVLFHWVLLARNGQTLGTSETYYSKSNAVRAARKVARAVNVEFKEK